jgi:transcriptional regulator with GAF, ATPase, and Fis domain
MHTTQKTNTIFLAPDDAENAEGVAGQAWSSDQVIIVKNLPVINRDSTDEKVREYAKRTFTSEAWVRKRFGRRQRSRAICGIPVEVNNERWGVIVLDSVRPDSIKDSAQAWEHYRKLVPIFLAEILRRGST